MIDAFCHILPPRYEETRWARAGSKTLPPAVPRTCSTCAPDARHPGPALILAAIALGFGLGAEVDVIGFTVSRYFGMRSFGEIYGCMFAIFTVGTGLGPVLMGLTFDKLRSYELALAVFGVSLVCASVLVSRLGRYNFPCSVHQDGAHRPRHPQQ